MDCIFTLILNTIILRPYVFVFLLIYLLGCSFHLGVKRAVLFCITGYLIAWLSEYSSIHNGIPYGYYYYIEQTKGKELWVLGVPFFDSLSYVFLAYASYSIALMVIVPVLRIRGIIYLLETKKIRNSIYTTILGAILFVYLDIIIDPVTLLGDRWFLGQIYGYPQKGIYFGVPISNFIGWLVVGFLMIYALQKIDSHLYKGTDWFGYKYPWRYIIGPGLYLGVIIFNLSITFYIREYNLGWVGIFIVLLPSFFIYSIIKLKLSHKNLDETLKAHLSDFPQAVIPEYTAPE
jgi:putative membrane protein